MNGISGFWKAFRKIGRVSVRACHQTKVHTQAAMGVPVEIGKTLSHWR
ncbi:MAG: hypothetical protein OXC07_05350 [Kistimonas sp.]|nr:hypothetical protein [Kistimonas sp.]